MQKVRSHPCGLLLFVCMRFQDLFHSPPGVLFAFPSQYWFAIGRLRVFSLGGWSPHLRAGFHVSRSTSRKLSTLNPISRTGLSPSVAGLSRPFQYRIQYHLQALPISLAATFRISVDFFSCSYLDVSVRCVRLLKLCIHFKIPLRVSSLIRTSVDQCSLASRTVDVNKLRMTGFECFATFVIRRAKHTPKGAARHWRQELCLGIKIN